MRPHRDVTPVLLAAVALLFLLLAARKLRDRVYGHPERARAARTRELLRLRGEQALEEALEVVRSQGNQPESSLFGLFRSGESLAFSLPVTAAGEDLPEGVGLHRGRVQAELQELRPFVPGALPHRGQLRLEATFLEAGERVARRVRELPFRLVRLGPPPPLGHHALVLLEGDWLVPGDPVQEELRAREDLERLVRVRRDLEARLEEVSHSLAGFVRAHRHLDGPSLDAAELLRELRAHLGEAPPLTAPGESPEPLPRPLTLVAHWWAVDLASWEAYRRWSLHGPGHRLQQAQAFEVAWERWSRVLEELFLPGRWSGLRGGNELAQLLARSRASLGLALGELSAALGRWQASALQTVTHHQQLPATLEVVEGAEREAYLATAARLGADAWRGQAGLVFEGEGAADRCSRFLEGASGPFARSLHQVVFLDNAGAAPLVLREKTIPGQLVLVATGEVRLADVGPRDSRSHRLTVQAEGRLVLEGRIRAFLVARGGLEMRSGCVVSGGLFLPRVRPGDVLEGRVEGDPGSLPEDVHEDLVVLLDEPGDGSGEGDAPPDDLSPAGGSPGPGAR